MCDSLHLVPRQIADVRIPRMDFTDAGFVAEKLTDFLEREVPLAVGAEGVLPAR
jgi:hypothetical protein